MTCCRPRLYFVLILLLLFLATLVASLVSSALVNQKCGYPWRRPKPRSTVALPITNCSPKFTGDDLPPCFANQELISLLQRFEFDRRLKVLASKDLPVTAEVFLNGTSHICEITALRPTKDPTVQVKLLVATNNDDQGNSETKNMDGIMAVVDIGQVTTIWDSKSSTLEQDEEKDSNSNLHRKIEDQLNRFPVGTIEEAMDSLYKSRVGRARSSKSDDEKIILTKKQITNIVSRTNMASESERLHAENVLRQATKAGRGCVRLVDSLVAADFIYNKNDEDNNNNNNYHTNDDYNPEQAYKNERGVPGAVNRIQQAVAAQLLAQDSELGGRFKRMPCTFVEKDTTIIGEVESLTVINGGWLVVDQSNRAGAEARKFAERAQTAAIGATASTLTGDEPQPTTSSSAWTISDERILQRLECLAMGGIFSSEDEADSSDPSADLEVDVREALKALDAPITPEGARKVLLKIGRWSEDQKSSNALFGYQPWSPDILEAARWYAESREKIKYSLAKINQNNDQADLTNIPFVCVDAARTSFRDDAVGVRPRAGTGRRVSGASKWEILVSIVDVSNIYTDLENNDEKACGYLKTLRNAASSRAVSRYDLPFGPLHLMPPSALQSLSFDAVDASAEDPEEVAGAYNTCVTVWVYIDERTGKLLDWGIERSIISRPIALSYEQASDLLKGKVDTSHRPLLARAKPVLGVVERNIQLWSLSYRSSSEAAQKREERLALKEFVAKQQSLDRRRDDGFRRTRGHKLVDASLDLYSYVVDRLLRQAKAFVPQQAGSDRRRGGRVATAPLRRYVDGMAQRQALSVLCEYGSAPMTREECARVSKDATDAYNIVFNVRATKTVKMPPMTSRRSASEQKVAVRKLAAYLAHRSRKIIPAVSTGRGNEVVIKGVGALAKCRGMKPPLKPGEEILVEVHRLNVEKGEISVNLVETPST